MYHLTIGFNACYTLLMCKIGLKYQYASWAVCVYAYIFGKRPWCALIGACALIGTYTVTYQNP